MEDLKYFSKFDIFLQTLVNETALKSELESMKVTFQSEIDTKASQNDLQTLKVSIFIWYTTLYTYRTHAIITRGLYIFYPLFILKSGLYYRQFMD